MQHEFVSQHSGFFLTLKNLNYHLFEKGDKKGDEKGEEKEKKTGKAVAERTELVYSAICNDPTITINRLTVLLNISKNRLKLLSIH